MNKLFRYNLSLVFGRWVIYVVPLVSLLAIIICNLLLKSSTTNNFMLNNNWIVYGILFFFSVIFVIQTTLVIFKSPKEDMTNALVFSRPFSKKQIFFSQVGVNFICIVVYSIFIGLSYFVISATYASSSAFESFKFGAGVFIGSVGIMLVFASLISLTTLLLSSAWVSFIWTILAIFIPLGSFVSNFYINKTFSAVVSSKYSLVGQDETAEEIYLDTRNATPNNNAQARSFDEVKDNPYYSLAWIDPWYQLSGLYSMFDSRVDEKDARWEASSQRLDSSLTLNINSRDVHIITRQTPEIMTEENHLQTLKNSNEFTSFIDANKNDISALTVERQLLLFQKFINNKDIAQIKANYAVDLANVKAESLDLITFSVDTYAVKLWNSLHSKFDSTKTDFDLNSMYSSKYSSNFIFVPSDISLPEYIKHPIIEKYAIALIWVGILFITSSAGMIVFIKKDN